MNNEQQNNLNDIWDDLKNGNYDGVGRVRPVIDKDCDDEQAMILPLDNPPGGNVRVTRNSKDEEWRIG